MKNSRIQSLREVLLPALVALTLFSFSQPGFAQQDFSASKLSESDVTVSGFSFTGFDQTEIQRLDLERPDFGSIFEIGDWSSSGSEPMPYEPRYNYSYLCQIQLTNGLYYNSVGEPISWDERETIASRTNVGENRAYSLYAFSTFRFNKKNKFVETDSLRWKTVKYYGIDRVEDTNESPQVQTRGHFIGIAFEQGEVGAGTRGKPAAANDLVGLYLNITQPVGALEFSANKTTFSQRSFPQFEAYVSADVKSTRTKKMPSYQMRVVCRKEK